MKLSVKICLMIKSKVRKNQGFTFSLEKTVLEKRQGGVKLTLNLFRVKHCFVYTEF